MRSGGGDIPAGAGGGVFLVTGISAAGKSSVAEALARRLPLSVHVRGDAFRRMIVNGRAGMTAELTPEALRQLRLRHRLSAQVADGYVEAGFTAVLQDVVIGAELEHMVEHIRSCPLHVIVLAPSREVVVAREKARSKSGYGDDVTVEALDRALHEQTPRSGMWIDTSAQTVTETVDEIIWRASADAGLDRVAGDLR